MSDGRDATKGRSLTDKEKLKKLMEKEARGHRTPTGIWHWITALIGAFMVLFYFYAAGVATIGTQYHLGVYVCATYLLVFLLYPAGRPATRGVLSVVLGLVLVCAASALFVFRSARDFHAQMTFIFDSLTGEGLAAALLAMAPVWYLLPGALILGAALYACDRAIIARDHNIPTVSDALFALLAAGAVYYWISQFEALNYRAGAENEMDSLVSMVGMLLSLEVCRRVLGWSMTFIGIGMLGFAYFGPYLPEILAHRGIGIERIATALFLTTNGVFGVMANVLATYVILFIFFGSFLHKSGAGRFFIDLPLALAGRSTGGPAKVAVIASALFGSVSGSAIANTVSTGAFTIPLMKKAGFKPHVAGAIEPSASIGGMFLPPIMGAG